MAKDCTTCVETQEKQAKLDAVIKEHKGSRGALIPVLHEAQEIYGYLPLEVQLEIANGLDIPLAEVYGVVSFYTRFSINPKGKYLVNVCMGTACYVKGAGLILEKFKECLDLEVDECSEDGKFSLEACRCIGACGLAPVITINEDVYGRLNPEDVAGIVEKYKNL